MPEYRHVRTIEDAFPTALRGIAVDRENRLWAVGDSECKFFDAEGAVEQCVKEMVGLADGLPLLHSTLLKRTYYSNELRLVQKRRHSQFDCLEAVLRDVSDCCSI